MEILSWNELIHVSLAEKLGLFTKTSIRKMMELDFDINAIQHSNLYAKAPKVKLMVELFLALPGRLEIYVNFYIFRDKTSHYTIMVG